MSARAKKPKGRGQLLHEAMTGIGNTGSDIAATCNESMFLTSDQVKILLSLTVRGKRSTWGFRFYGDPKYIPEWRADGLDVTIIENSIPAWWVDAGLPVRLWCFCQDVFHFRNPWRK